MQLNQAEIIQQNQQMYLVSGVVDFSTVPDLIQSSSDIFKSYKKSVAANVSTNAKTGITMDMSKITVCNSAGLALILEMVRQADNYNIELRFKSWPVALLTIAKAYGVDDEIRDLI